MHNYQHHFPIFKSNPDLVFLDSAASAQKLEVAIEAEHDFYCQNYANVHRGIYKLSECATSLYEAAREGVAEFFGVQAQELIFCRGATEAINLVAYSYLEERLGEGDEIVISVMEHHANIVPWVILSQKVGAKLVVVPMDEQGQLNMERFHEVLCSRTKLVAMTHVSNVLGTINPVSEIVEAAHAVGAKVLIDGAQAAAHMPVNIRELGVDFYTASSHKMYGPTGIGFLYVRDNIINTMRPYQGGGNMIATVAFDRVTYLKGPMRFEAGTPNIGGAIGFHAAVQFLQDFGMDKLAAHEESLLQVCNEKLQSVSGLTVHGTAPGKAAIISFSMERIHPHDLATILDRENVAVRAGHHCAMPLIKHLGVSALTRASFGLSNIESDVDALVNALNKARRLFG